MSADREQRMRDRAEAAATEERVLAQARRIQRANDVCDLAERLAVAAMTGCISGGASFNTARFARDMHNTAEGMIAERERRAAEAEKEAP